jgi:hypothetical protein
VRVPVKVPRWSALLSLLRRSQVRQRHANDVAQERVRGAHQIRNLLELLPQVSLVVAVTPPCCNRHMTVWRVRCEPGRWRAV